MYCPECGAENRPDARFCVDGQGCPGVRVAIDGGAWFWRVRDLELP
jgi:hypothetical protein